MNNKTFYLKYIELTIKNNNISVVKQVLISIVAFFGMAILSLFDMYLLKVIILIYLLLSSFILFIDNEVFLNIEDIENLMIRSSDRRFPIVFIIQRYFRDTYIFNTILLFILLIYTGIFNQNVFLWLCITILFYYGSVPYEYLANYKNNYLIIMNVVFKLLLLHVS